LLLLLLPFVVCFCLLCRKRVSTSFSLFSVVASFASFRSLFYPPPYVRRRRRLRWFAVFFSGVARRSERQTVYVVFPKFKSFMNYDVIKYMEQPTTAAKNEQTAGPPGRPVYCNFVLIAFLLVPGRATPFVSLLLSSRTNATDSVL